MTLRAKLAAMIGKRRTPISPEAALAALSGSLKVHAGEDGWLFLVGGPNRPLDSYGRSLGWWWTIHRWARLVRRRERRCRRAGIGFVQMVVPEKLSVLGGKAPALAVDGGRAPVRRLARQLAGCGAYLDLVPVLEGGAGGPDLYLRTDTHWSNVGCYRAYRALCQVLGAQPVELTAYPAEESAFTGDLGLKLDPAPVERRRVSRFGRDAARVHASPLVRHHEALDAVHPGRFALHRGAHVGFRNESAGADPRRLVLFGDSCANYEPFHLTAMLAETFREVHFAWSSSLDWRLIEGLRPDILVAEVAERFLFHVPDDRFDLAAVGESLIAARGSPGPEPATR